MHTGGPIDHYEVSTFLLTQAASVSLISKIFIRSVCRRSGLLEAQSGVKGSAFTFVPIPPRIFGLH